MTATVTAAATTGGYNWDTYSPSPTITCEACHLWYGGQTESTAQPNSCQLPNGMGTLTCTRSDLDYSHTGAFKNGKRHGHGMSVYVGGMIEITGEWQNDAINGFGTIAIKGPFSKSSFKRYRGNLCGSLPHCRLSKEPSAVPEGGRLKLGLQELLSGHYYYGEFAEGERDGKGSLFDPFNRLVYSGHWKGNQAKGYAEWYKIYGDTPQQQQQQQQQQQGHTNSSQAWSATSSPATMETRPNVGDVLRVSTSESHRRSRGGGNNKGGGIPADYIYVGYVEAGKPEYYGRLYMEEGSPVAPDSNGSSPVHSAIGIEELGLGSYQLTRQRSQLVYDGQWRLGLPHGRGTSYTPVGTYEGCFYRGMKHGLGTFSYTESPPAPGSNSDTGRTIIHGVWVNDQLQKALSPSDAKKRFDVPLTQVELIRGPLAAISNECSFIHILKGFVRQSENLWKSHLAKCLQTVLPPSPRDSHVVGGARFQRGKTINMDDVRDRGRRLKVIVRTAEGSFAPQIGYYAVAISYNGTDETTSWVPGGGKNQPTWNQTLVFPLRDATLRDPEELYVQLKGKSSKDNSTKVLGGCIHQLDRTPVLYDLEELEQHSPTDIVVGYAKATIIGKDSLTGMKVPSGRIHMFVVVTDSDEPEDNRSIVGQQSPTSEIVGVANSKVKSVVAANTDLVRRLETLLASPRN